MAKINLKLASALCVTVALMLIVGCSGAILTQNDFATISVGETIANVEAVYGQAYDVTPSGNGLTEYRYIERCPVTSTVDEFKYLVFSVTENGRIVDKRMERIGTNMNVNYN